MKKILLILAAVMLIMSVCVVASADGECQTITFTATSEQRNGIGSGINCEFVLNDITPGTYLITASVASQSVSEVAEKGTKHAMLEAWVTPARHDWSNATYVRQNVETPMLGWSTFKQVVFGTYTFTGNDKFLYIVTRDNMCRLANVSLTPVPEGTITVSQADNASQIQMSSNGSQTMSTGMGTNATAWIQTYAPNGKYALFANIANNVSATITCYLNSAFNKDYISVVHNLRVPRASATASTAWQTFTDMFIGYVDITDTHKMVTIQCASDNIRIKSITLVPIEPIRPSINYIQGGVQVTTLAPGSVTARTNVTTATDNKAYTPIAAYYENGKLISAKLAVNNSYKSGEYDVSFDGIVAGENNYVKMFVWDNLENCYPYIEAVTAPIVQ